MRTWRTKLWLLKGRVQGRDSQGVWDLNAHTAIFKMDNQGPAGQHRELCSILPNNLMVTMGEMEGKGIVREFGMDRYTI